MKEFVSYFRWTNATKLWSRRKNLRKNYTSICLDMALSVKSMEENLMLLKFTRRCLKSFTKILKKLFKNWNNVKKIKIMLVVSPTERPSPTMKIWLRRLRVSKKLTKTRIRTRLPSTAWMHRWPFDLIELFWLNCIYISLINAANNNYNQ